MAFSDYWSGTPPTTQMQGWTPWIQSPSYNFSSKLYDYLSSMIGAPAPQYQGMSQFGRIAKRQNPYLDDMTSLANNYFNLGMPTAWSQATGSLGRYMSPSFVNPVARMQLGAPNMFGSQAIPSPYAPPQLPSSAG